MLDITKPQVIHLPDTFDAQQFLHVHFSDAHGTFQIVDVVFPDLCEMDIPYGTFLHSVKGQAEIRLETGGSKPWQLDRDAFIQLPPAVYSIQSLKSCRLICVQRHAPAPAPFKAKKWPEIDRIPITKRPGGIKLWSAYAETELPRGIGYEYFVIGRSAIYSRTYIPEAPPHSHANSDSLVYVTNGSGICTLGNEEHAIQMGSFVVIPRGVRHGFRGTPSFTASSIQWNEVGEDYRFDDS